MRRLLLLAFLLPAICAAQPDAGVCHQVRDAAGNLVCDLDLVRAAAGSQEMDLDSLGERLRNTDAIGLFGKLSIKGRVNDLLDRAPQASSPADLEKLRADFERLLADVNRKLVEGGNPALASDVTRSRESLWRALRQYHPG